jgi:hypothetical protein
MVISSRIYGQEQDVAGVARIVRFAQAHLTSQMGPRQTIYLWKQDAQKAVATAVTYAMLNDQDMRLDLVTIRSRSDRRGATQAHSCDE